MPVFYVFSAIMVQFTPKWVEKRLVLILACALSFATNLFTGPSQIFSIPNTLTMMAVGQAMHGIFDPYMLVPSLPEMIDAGLKRFPEQEALVNDLSSGIFNCFLGLGQISGPLFGSFMEQKYGFRLTCDWVAFISLGIALLYFCFGKGWVAIQETARNRRLKKMFLKTELEGGYSMKMRLLDDEEQKGPN